MIPVSVVIATKNEEAAIGACLEALRGFEEIIVVDSNSRDKTAEIAARHDAQVLNFDWNKQYPKKRQWILDNVSLKFDWVFFVDADEWVTLELKKEIEKLFAQTPDCAGYFVKGRHILNGKLLKYGLQNNKLALFDRRKIEFPAVSDLDIPGMGEIEGHYQPVLKADFKQEKLHQIKAPIIHKSLDDERRWIFRHEKYARWEAGMNKKNAWPNDPLPWRNMIKKLLRRNKFRPQIIFLLSYFALQGLLDGKEGLNFSLKKMQYYKLIAKL